MNDEAFHELLRRGRTAQAGMDLSALEAGFESRLALRLAAQTVVTPSQLIWRSAAGCAALVGMMAVWFLLIRAPAQTEDDLTAYWTADQSVWTEELN